MLTWRRCSADLRVVSRHATMSAYEGAMPRSARNCSTRHSGVHITAGAGSQHHMRSTGLRLPVAGCAHDYHASLLMMMSQPPFALYLQAHYSGYLHCFTATLALVLALALCYALAQSCPCFCCASCAPPSCASSLLPSCVPSTCAAPASPSLPH